MDGEQTAHPASPATDGDQRGPGASRFLVATAVVSVLVVCVHLLPPMDGVVVAGCIVTLSLVLAVRARVPGGLGPLLLFAMTSFVFVWARPLVSLTSRDFDLGVIEVLGGITVSPAARATYLRVVACSMIAFAAATVLLMVRGDPAIDRTRRRSPSVSEGAPSRSGFWLGCLAVGVLASLVQSLLYARFFLAGGSYYDVYVLGKDAVTFPGLSLLSSLLFYGYVGLLAYGRPSDVARKRWALLFAFMCLLSLFRGSRGEAFAQLLVGIWLYFFTARRMPSVAFWAVVLGSLVCIAEVVSMLRSGVGVDERDTGVQTQLAWFVYTQGLSGELVAAAHDAFGVGPQNLRFILSPLLAPARQLLDPSFGSQTDWYGRSSGLLAHELAYRADSDLYIAGRGAGSSYLAEVHCAFGMVGVIVATAAIVWLLGWATKRALEGRTVLFVLACMLPYLLFIPRESLLFFVGPVLKALVLLLLCRMVEQRLLLSSRRVPSPV